MMIRTTGSLMQESERIPVHDGRAQFSLAATSYTTVIGGNSAGQ